MERGLGRCGGPLSTLHRSHQFLSQTPQLFPTLCPSVERRSSCSHRPSQGPLSWPEHAEAWAALKAVPSSRSAWSSSSAVNEQDDSQQQSGLPLPPPSSTLYVEGEFVEVGKVTGAFGVQGEVRLECKTDNPKARFGKAGNVLFLRPPPRSGLLARMQPAAEQGMMKVTTSGAKVRVLGKGEEAWIVKFSQLSDVSQAEQLQGYSVLIPAKNRERLKDPDEFWVQELAGSHVFLKTSGEYVGVVHDILSGFGVHDTLLVRLAMDKRDIHESTIRQCMVPFVKAICPTVDRKLRQIEIDPPEGLLDLTSSKPMKRPFTEEQQAQRLEALNRKLVPLLGQPLSPEAQAALNIGFAKLKARPSSSLKVPDQDSEGGDSELLQARTESHLERMGGGRQQAGGTASASKSKRVGGDEGSSRRGASKKVAVVVKEEEEEEEEAWSTGEQEEEGALRQETTGRVSSGVQSAVHREEGEETGAEPDSPESSASSERWKLRQKMGVSFAATTRRALARRKVPRRAVKKVEDEEEF